VVGVCVTSVVPPLAPRTNMSWTPEGMEEWHRGDGEGVGGRTLVGGRISAKDHRRIGW